MLKRMEVGNTYIYTHIRGMNPESLFRTKLQAQNIVFKDFAGFSSEL